MKLSLSKILNQFIRIIFLLIGISCCFSIFEPSLFDSDYFFDPDYIALKILCLFLFCAGISLIYFSLRAWPKGIGFFECINNQSAANLLFETSITWLKEKKIEAMDGPINFGEKDK